MHYPKTRYFWKKTTLVLLTELSSKLLNKVGKMDNTLMNILPNDKSRKQTLYDKCIGSLESILGSEPCLSHLRESSFISWLEAQIMCHLNNLETKFRSPVSTWGQHFLAPMKLGFGKPSLWAWEDWLQRFPNSTLSCTPFTLSGSQAPNVSADHQLILSGRKHHFNCKVHLPKIDWEEQALGKCSVMCSFKALLFHNLV